MRATSIGEKAQVFFPIWHGTLAYLDPGGVDKPWDDVNESVQLEYSSKGRIGIGVILMPLQVIWVHDLVHSAEHGRSKAMGGENISVNRDRTIIRQDRAQKAIFPRENEE